MSPENMVPGMMGMPAAAQLCGEWQKAQPLSAVAIYRPRSRRCGVRSNVRPVSARALGPINGRHPIVSVIADATTTITPTRSHLPSRAMKFPGDDLILLAEYTLR